MVRDSTQARPVFSGNGKAVGEKLQLTASVASERVLQTMPLVKLFALKSLSKPIPAQQLHGELIKIWAVPKYHTLRLTCADHCWCCCRHVMKVLVTTVEDWSTDDGADVYVDIRAKVLSPSTSCK